MSWEMASFLILGVVLLGGFAWYERSRPPAQVVALVAALAALAIAGRVAFAAFPNVKPTTDIVIFAGYALGGAPGFAVGALAALVSNFWFGQGPWTPWQMLGWGLCGVLGAALALGGRNVGRLTLALACGLAGVAYGALLNFSLMATYGGDLSWQRFLLLEGRAVPFDAAHAAGNFAIALVAGPAMLRMLVRFRRRFEWRRREAPPAPPAPAPPDPPGEGREPEPALAPSARLRGTGVAALLVLALLLALAAPPRAAAASGPAAAASWLRGAENGDGGWGAATDSDSDPAMTAWSMLALAAAGANPLDVGVAGHGPVDYLRGQLGSLKSPGDLARTILALQAGGLDPRRFGGQDLVARLLAKRRTDGSYEGWPNTTAFAAVALRAAGAGGGLSRTLRWLREAQNDDGGWGDLPGSPSTADGTGAVLQVLSPDSKPAQRGLAYLRKSQRPGGGFPLGGAGVVNAQSTAWALEGIAAAGADPAGYRRGGASGLDYLAARQAPDGHYRYSKSSDQTPVWVTADTLVATAGAHYPIAAPPRQGAAKQAGGKDGGAKNGKGKGAGGKKAGGKKGAPLSPAPTNANSGAATPPTGSPSFAVPGSGAGATPVSPSGSTSGGAGSPPERFATPGSAPPEAPAGTSSPGGRVSEGSGTTAPDPLVSPSSLTPDSATATDSDSSPLGAIVTGLLAGCLLFGLGLLVRRAWMRWRYGL